MSKLSFKKGDFITQNTSPGAFAIFEGNEYASTERSCSVFSLICYYNPNHKSFKADDGKYIREYVFEYDLDDEKTCEYGIYADDLNEWRKCTEYEIDEALKTLSINRLAWIETTNKFRRLKPNEQICFDKPKSTGIPGGNVQRTSPMYGNTSGIVTPSSSRSSISLSRKIITRVVNDDWEQKEPITTMNSERKSLVIEQCDKLKFAFNTYNYNNVTIYPANGAQIPIRTGHQYLGYGMCAYNALMNETEHWGYYDCE